MTRGSVHIQPRLFYRITQIPRCVPGWAEPPEPCPCSIPSPQKMLLGKKILNADDGSLAEQGQGEDGAGDLQEGA